LRFLDKAKPLTNITKKGKEFQWTAIVKRAFKAIKDAFRAGDMQTYFNPE
jgi:hypothetical protein